jgi:hypothetical protein
MLEKLVLEPEPEPDAEPEPEPDAEPEPGGSWLGGGG